MDAPDFLTLAEAAECAGVRTRTLREWVRCGFFRFSPTDKVGKAGVTALFSQQSIDRILQAASLIRAGVQTRVAWQVAMGDEKIEQRLRDGVNNWTFPS